MVGEVRKVLLSKLISMEGLFEGKYTTAYNSIKSIIELEQKEKGKNRLSKEIFDKFKQIEKLTTNLDDKVKTIPLIIVEQYLMRNSANLEKYVYMAHGDVEVSDVRIIDLYLILESFFEKIYSLAVEISDYYSIEIKLKDTKSKNNQSDESSSFI